MSAFKSPTPRAKRKSFSEVLEQIEFGGVSQQATDELNDLIHAITETGKSGSMTLTIKIKPIGNTGQVEIDADVKAKQPAPTRGKTLMFCTPDNNMQRENLRQQSIEGLRTVDEEVAASGPLRAVN